MDSFCCCDKGVLIGVYTLSYSLLVVPEWSRGGPEVVTGWSRGG